MTITPADLAPHPGPAYRAIAEALAGAIEKGRLRPGDRLPPQRELAWQLDVTVGTVGRAYEIVTRRGLVRGEVGRGTYVMPPAAPSALEPGPRFHLARPSPARGVIDLASNVPTPVGAQGELAAAIAAAAADPDLLAGLAAYPPTAGLAAHRERAARWLCAQGVPAEAGTVVLAGGAQAALSAALSATAPPGSPVLVEQLTYNGVRALGRRLGLRLEPVALDAEGAIPESLEACARATGARVAVLCPNVQNPTAAIMGEARRRRVAEVARALDLLLIVDDVYGPLLDAAPTPLAALAPERTLHIAGASKFLAPGLRVGFVRAPEALAEAVAEAMAQLVLCHPPLTAEVFCRALDAGTVGRAIAAQRAEAAARRALAAELLPGAAEGAAAAGLHLWLPLPEPWSSAELSLALAREGVLVAPAERFHVGRGAPPRAIRLSLSCPPTRDALREGLGRVAGHLRRRTPALDALV